MTLNSYLITLVTNWRTWVVCMCADVSIDVSMYSNHYVSTDSNIRAGANLIQSIESALPTPPCVGSVVKTFEDCENSRTRHQLMGNTFAHRQLMSCAGADS